MSTWYQMHERGAGRLRIEFLWMIYKLFGINFLKFVVKIISGTIAIFAPKVRQQSIRYRKILNEYQQKQNLSLSKFTPLAHICNFACSVVDKISAICDTKTPLEFDMYNNSDMQRLQKMLDDNKGVFFISSHLGNIETLSAMPAGQNKRMNAFMNVGQNQVFREFVAKKAKYTNTIIHPTENIGVAVAGNMYDAIKRGELVLMAGDRISPTAPDKVINVKILNHNCALPIGVFRFARACDCPVFAVVNIKTEKLKYRMFVKQLNTSSIDIMVQEYAKFIEEMMLKYPEQWFNFFDFFGNN